MARYLAMALLTVPEYIRAKISPDPGFIIWAILFACPKRNQLRPVHL